MYLSRLLLGRRSRLVQRDLADPYQMHQTVMRGFPSQEAGGPGRVLFRVDEWQGGQAWALVVQSQRAPEWGWLARDQWRGYLAQVDGNPACKEWQPNLRAGQALAFRLRANPTVKRNGDRLGLFKQEDQEAWLQRKLAAAGARLVRVQMRPEGMSQGFAHDDAGKTLHMKLFAVRMDGVLQVLEPLPLAAAMEAGIGSGKGFGFGLLSLAPV